MTTFIYRLTSSIPKQKYGWIHKKNEESCAIFINTHREMIRHQTTKGKLWIFYSLKKGLIFYVETKLLNFGNVRLVKGIQDIDVGILKTRYTKLIIKDENNINQILDFFVYNVINNSFKNDFRWDLALSGWCEEKQVQEIWEKS